MSKGRYRTPYYRNDVWRDGVTQQPDEEDDFSRADHRIDLEKAIHRLPSWQRVATHKWIRDEVLTASERKAFSEAKKLLAKWLK